MAELKRSPEEMNYRPAPIVLLVALVGCATTPEPKKSAQPAPSLKPAAQISVTRYTERPLSEFQTRVMNAATKLSYACRLFRSLYGRWPKDIAEIQSKTEGIDFGIFLGKASVTPQSDDSALLEVFDGTNFRATKAVPVPFTIPEKERAAAQEPGYKIKL